MKRICIIGTAGSWRDAPWADPGLEFWALNDSWSLNLPRIDRHFELHPLDRMYFRPLHNKLVYAEDVPHGFYVRPEGHLEQLQMMARSIPVYLQNDPPPGWPPNAKRLPIEQLEAAFGTYWASGPSYEVALAMLEGATEIQVWGIHLETEHEYREQRPNFEGLLMRAIERGIKVVMAPQSPLLKHGWKYGYEAKPAPHPAKERIQRVRHEKMGLIQALATWPRFKSKAAPLDRLRRLEAQEMDCVRILSQRKVVVIDAPVLTGASHG